MPGRLGGLLCRQIVLAGGGFRLLQLEFKLVEKPGCPLRAPAIEVALELFDLELQGGNQRLIAGTLGPRLSAAPVTMADGAAIADLLLDDCAGLPNAGVHGAKLVAFSHLRDLLARQGMPGSEADTFGAGVAAFDCAAEKALSLPLEPTDAMVDAACVATGCTPEKARAGFAAMVEAFCGEAA